MAFPDYEKLFLLEVLVEEVNISLSNLNLDLNTKSNLKETCVTFQFLNYPSLVVCEEDFSKSPPDTSNSQLNFKSGKSCLFSLRSSLVPTLPYKFDVYVSVLRKLEPKGQILLGTSVINLGDSFTALMHSSVAEPDLPLQKTKVGRFDVCDENEKLIGYIMSFLRLSCFGKLIVTQFQASTTKDMFLFKGTEQKKVVEMPGDSSKIPKILLDPNYLIPQPDMPAVKSAPLGDGDMTYGMSVPFKNDTTNMSCNQYNYEQSPQTVDTTGSFKEIVAEIRGHSLHIRVPMKSKTEGKRKKHKAEEMEGPVCKYAQLDLCDCDFPVPSEAIPRCGPL